MAPLAEGNTLGQKHRNYNRILNETSEENVPEINYEDSDLDNLFRIDIACRNRNVDYVLRVLRCGDMLYASRAIKRSAWLVTDPQYAHLVNPSYIQRELAPHMMSKALNKFLLHIRLNLKDEKRVEEFFDHFKETDLKYACKWLPHCSLSFTEKVIQKHADVIPNNVMARICKKSVSCLKTLLKSNDFYSKPEILAATMVLLRNNVDSYLDVVEACHVYVVPRFGPKATKIIMRKSSDRVMKNIEKYIQFLHIPTFAKFIKQEDVKDFIKTNLKNKKIRSFFTYSKIKPFINRLPIESRFEFIKEVYIDRTPEECDEIAYDCCFGGGRGEEAMKQNIYRWYAFAPFNIAFVDLKKLIRSESNPDERTSMLGVMLTCAGKNTKNIHAVLKYYRENHINEPFKFKIQFVNLVISYTSTHKFDKETWGYLNELFNSMDVYTESEKLDQNCVRAVILYNVTHNEAIPEIVQKKFLFDTYKINQKDLSEEEKAKVFAYLYNYLKSKIEAKKVTDEKEFSEAVEELKNMLNLLFDWKKELKDYPVVLEKIRELVQINKKNKWNQDVSVLYNFNKSWRKLLFAESIAMSATEEACINALKHGPELLELYKNDVETLCMNDKALTDRFLKKIRIYWSQSLAEVYKDLFKNKMDQKNSHRAAIIGLCLLLKKNDILNLIQKHAPSESKIDWSQHEDLELNLRKNIASSIHLARPQPSPSSILLYAKGDYLQFALPSLNAILYNISSTQAREHLPHILDSPVSLQKHGIKAAFTKLNYDELKSTFSNIWKTNKNSSIRAAIFVETLNFLCKEKEQSVIKEIWELVSVFIDNLTAEEDKNIYTKLSQADKVPKSVRPHFWMKSYKFIQSLPPKLNRDALLYNLRNNSDDVSEFIDNDFARELFFESFEENFRTKRYDFTYIVVEFLLSARTEEASVGRYKAVLVPMMERALEMWNNPHEGTNYVRSNLSDILSSLNEQFEKYVLQKNMILPVEMFQGILNKLQEKLPLDENYVFITTRKLSLDCLKIMKNLLKTDESVAKALSESTDDNNQEKFKPLYARTAEEFGKTCVKHLKEDVSNINPSIYILFAKSFKDIFNKFNFGCINKMKALKAFLELRDFIPGYLFALKSLPKYAYEDDVKALKAELLKEISAHPSKEVKIHCNSYEHRE